MAETLGEDVGNGGASQKKYRYSTKEILNVKHTLLDSPGLYVVLLTMCVARIRGSSVSLNGDILDVLPHIRMYTTCVRTYTIGVRTYTTYVHTYTTCVHTYTTCVRTYTTCVRTYTTGVALWPSN